MPDAPSSLAFRPAAMRRRRPAGALPAIVLAFAAVLAGCAGPRIISADVTSFANWPEARRPTTFAFERLPSQQAQPDRQAQLENTALPALATAGFKPAAEGSAADVLVQVSARTLRYDRGYYGDPFLRGGGLYGGYGGRWRGGGVGLGLGYGWAPPWYVTEVAMLLRDARTKQVLYETRAQHEGSWADDAVRAALFEAAMKDFPRPAVNPRRITVQLGPG